MYYSCCILDIQRPTLQGCPVSKLAFTQRGLDTAVLNWTAPEAWDNAGAVTLVQSAGPTPGTSAKAGTYYIEYTAVDKAGNKAYPCRFNIFVRRKLSIVKKKI